MKYLVPRLRVSPKSSSAELWITDTDGARVMRIEVAPDDREYVVIILDTDGDVAAIVSTRRHLGGTVAEVGSEGRTFARLARPRKGAGAVSVRTATGDYDIAGDFAAWDFSVLLNASPVADVVPRKTGDNTYLIEISDHEDQAPLLATVLAVDLLVQAAG